MDYLKWKNFTREQETAGILIQKIREQLGKDRGIENQVAGILIDKIESNFPMLSLASKQSRKSSTNM